MRLLALFVIALALLVFSLPACAPGTCQDECAALYDRDVQCHIAAAPLREDFLTDCFGATGDAGDQCVTEGELAATCAERAAADCRWIASTEQGPACQGAAG